MINLVYLLALAKEYRRLRKPSFVPFLLRLGKNEKNFAAALVRNQTNVQSKRKRWREVPTVTCASANEQTRKVEAGAVPVRAKAMFILPRGRLIPSTLVGVSPSSVSGTGRERWRGSGEITRDSSRISQTVVSHGAAASFQRGPRGTRYAHGNRARRRSST